MDRRRPDGASQCSRGSQERYGDGSRSRREPNRGSPGWRSKRAIDRFGNCGRTLPRPPGSGTGNRCRPHARSLGTFPEFAQARTNAIRGSGKLAPRRLHAARHLPYLQRRLPIRWPLAPGTESHAGPAHERFPG